MGNLSKYSTRAVVTVSALHSPGLESAYFFCALEALSVDRTAEACYDTLVMDRAANEPCPADPEGVM